MLTILAYIFTLDSLLCTTDSTEFGLQRICGAETFNVFSPSDGKGSDGICFDKAWLLLDGASDLSPRRYEGKAKTLGYNYPKAIVAGGWLLTSYSVNKEDIQVTRIPLSQLP